MSSDLELPAPLPKALSLFLLFAIGFKGGVALHAGGFLARRFAATADGPRPRIDWGHPGRDAFLNGSVFPLLGSLLVGLVAGPRRTATMKPFIDTLFPGILTLFLLDMGLVAGRRLGDLRHTGVFAATFAVLAPLVNSILGLALAALLGLSHGDALLLVVLCASASYIAVPAALRVALPEANPGLYVTLSLAVTFPFNILVGIPLYDWAVTALG